ncbi:MAG: uroporphyrinogen-III synthase [Pseudomonadota bacterium]
MNILITRPLEDARPLRALLLDKGHHPIIEPLLEIVPRNPDVAPIDLSGVQALLFTSANGVRIFAQRIPDRSLPVFTVGSATAAAAQSAGFATVSSAGGDVSDLAALVRERLAPDQGCLFQPVASVRAGDLQADLQHSGFTLRRAIIYDALPAIRFSEGTRRALEANEIDGVLLFSPRTAETFSTLVRRDGLCVCLKRCLALCLSPAVEAKIGDLPWRDIRVAAMPDQKSLLACLDRTGQAVNEAE